MDFLRIRRPVTSLVTSVAIGLYSTHVAATETRIARYSEILVQPSDIQRDPLMSQVQSRVPDELTHVGEAIKWVLVPSGYRLAAETAVSPSLTGLMSLPLPDVHRSLFCCHETWRNSR